MISSICIKGLFGRFDYNIKTKDGGVTIITGPNGFGKSTILQLINGLSKGDLTFFYRLDFSSLFIVFDNNKEILFEKKGKDLFIDSIQIEFEKYLVGPIYRRIPWLSRLSSGVFVDRRNSMRIDESELLTYLTNLDYDSDESFFDYIIDDENENKNGIKKIIDNLKEWSGEVRIISEQRLIKKEYHRHEEDQVVEVINELPKQLVREIESVLSEYSKVANTLDGSYPQRLFSAKDGIKSEEEYRLKLEEVNDRFNKLAKYNLVDLEIIQDSKYDAKFSEALKIYFDDFSRKFEVFEPLIQKMDLFTQIVNDRLMFKKVSISRTNGFDVVDSDSKAELKLSQLSSGEKQEIVLFYDLIFNTKADLMLLLDEPEISLHISWQKKFLDDLLKVSSVIPMHAIVATHSPQIINNHWDIQIDLGEEYGG